MTVISIALLMLAVTLCGCIIYAIVKVFEVVEMNMASDKIPAPGERHGTSFTVNTDMHGIVPLPSKRTRKQKRHILNAEDVSNIRALYLTGGYRSAVLAERYQCSSTTIRTVLNGKYPVKSNNPGPIPAEMIKRISYKHVSETMTKGRSSQNGHKEAA